MVHGDFQHANILAHDDQITGVVDWDGVGAGDGETAPLHAPHHLHQLVYRTHNVLTIATDTPNDSIQIATLIIRDSNTGLAKRVQIAKFGARPRIVVLAAEERHTHVA